MTVGAREPRPVADAVADASRAVVATILATGEIHPAAADLLPTDLVLAAHGETLALAQELRSRREPITPDAIAVLAAQSGRSTRLPEGGRAGWASDLASRYAVIPARIPQLVDIIRGDAARRQIERVAVEAQSRARSGQQQGVPRAEAPSGASHTEAVTNPSHRR